MTLCVNISSCVSHTFYYNEIKITENEPIVFNLMCLSGNEN